MTKNGRFGVEHPKGWALMKGESRRFSAVLPTQQ